MPPPVGALEFLGLEGCAECVTRLGCILRAYGNLICRAVRITIVIVAILYVALNTLDVLFTTVLVLIQFHFSFSPLRFFGKRLSAFANCSLAENA
jgi:hypothetical protein